MKKSEWEKLVSELKQWSQREDSFAADEFLNANGVSLEKFDSAMEKYPDLSITFDEIKDAIWGNTTKAVLEDKITPKLTKFFNESGLGTASQIIESIKRTTKKTM